MESIVQDKSFKFALRIIKLYKFLIKNEKDYVLSKQILRSGTSIGANIEEALGAHSKRDFLSKISISYREARETKYWLRLLKEADEINQEQFNSMLKDCEELIKILSSILLTTKENLKT